MLSWWDVSLIFHVHFLCWVIDTMMIIFVWVWKEVYVYSYQLWMFLIIVLFSHKNLPCQLSQECILLNLCDWYMVGLCYEACFSCWTIIVVCYLTFLFIKELKLCEHMMFDPNDALPKICLKIINAKAMTDLIKFSICLE